MKREPFEFIKELTTLKPKVYHLTDGDFKSELDSHLHYGEGSFPLRELLAFVPDGEMVTNEAKRKNEVRLSEFANDYLYIREL